MGCFDLGCLDYHFDRYTIREIAESRSVERCSPVGFMVFRVIVGLWSFALGCLGLPAPDALTSWGLVWQGLFASLSAVSTIMSWRARTDPEIDHLERGNTQLSESMFHRWIMQFGQISITTNFTILVNYWSWLDHDTVEFLDFSVHGLPFLLAAIDFGLSGMRFELNHIWDSILFLALYLALNAFIVLVENDGEPIYGPLTWNNDKSAAIVCVMMITQVVGFLGFWGLSMLKGPGSQGSGDMMLVKDDDEKEDYGLGSSQGHPV
mmetsp:Transcript_5414/g.13195  ORF Transcript_5414/g.13195 Transcript_5414/m.13195 type:complete len:264 (+) Transcript_5414:108-899(+)